MTATSECPSAERLAAVAGGRADAAVTSHAEVCAGCRAILVDLRKALHDTVAECVPPLPGLGPGATVDRFVIDRRLGAGAMGVVYAARDPKLSRSIALKVVRPGRTLDQLGLRFEREAAAAAQVTHPNVVTVYDVGQHEDQIYIAMELVRGDTLRAWLAVSRPWREVIAKLIDAGRGLAAIHAAGLVHRDFKPDNVLIGEDGRARVTDFGLARPPADQASSEPTSPIATTLTQTGAFVGTPAYAAPEQLRGGEVDMRSDQFAFGITAWEALYGQRPFHAETYDALLTRSAPVATPATKVPAQIERVLRRAMSARSVDRYPTMVELTVALERACRRRRWPYLAGGALLVAGSFGLALMMLQPSKAPPDACAMTDRPLLGVWDAGVAANVTATFARSGHAGAAPNAVAVIKALDQQAASWREASSAVCVAHRDGLTSPEVAATQMSCLAERVTDLRVFVRELESADAMVVERAPLAAERFEDPERCRLVREVGLASAPHHAELARLQTTLELRGAAAARVALDKLRATAITRGDPRLEAELGFAAGMIAYNAGQPTNAIDELRTTIVLAERTGQPQVRVRASIGLANALVDLRQLEEAERLLELAQATLDRLGGDPMLELQLGVAQARVHHHRDHPGRALAVLERLSAAAARRPHQHSELLMLKADVLRVLGRSGEAAATLAQAVAVFDEIYGKSAGSISRLTTEVQQALVVGDPHRALQLGGRALAGAAPDDPETMVVRRMMFAAEMLLGRPLHARDHARGSLALALAIGDKAAAATSQADLGTASLELDDAAEALVAFRASAAIASGLGPDGKEMLLDARYGLGRALAVTHEFDEALAELDRVIPALERAVPRRVNQLAQAHASLASALWRRNRPGDRSRARAAMVTAIEQMQVHRASFQAADPLGRMFQHRVDREVARFQAWQAEHH